MADVNNSPNMSLPIPVVGVAPGPDYATYINSCLTLLDAHDHTPGQGVAITPAALDINASLPMQSNFIIDAAGLTLLAQSSVPAVGTVYQSGVDLYYVDGNGNNVRITDSGAVAGTPGSIANLVAPASASYVAASSVFVWESDTGIAADMDFGSAIMRDLSPNSTFALTLSPPLLSSNYTITLPSLPASQKIMSINASGTIAAAYDVDNSTLTIVSNTIKVANAGITATQMANNSIFTAAIQDAAVTVAKLAIPPNLTYDTKISGSGNWTCPANVNHVLFIAVGGGGGGGSGETGGTNGGGGGGGGGDVVIQPMAVTPGTNYAYSIGTGGAGGTAGGTYNGATGNNTTFNGVTAFGGIGGRTGNSTITSSNGDGGPGAQNAIGTIGGRGGQGLGRGGAGGTSGPGTAGTANTGGGGGGGGASGGNFTGGAGGSGVLYIVYVNNV